MTAVRVCGVADLASGEAMRVDVNGIDVAVVRVDDRWFAIGDVCTHREVSLADGEVKVETCELVCPLHGSPFSLVTGEPSQTPAVEPTPTFRVRIDGDDVMVEV